MSDNNTTNQNTTKTKTETTKPTEPLTSKLALFEEDDLFEEFGEEGFYEEEKDIDIDFKQWQEDWEEDNLEDQFENILRKELQTANN